MPVIARLIAEVTRLANEDSVEGKAVRLRLIIDDLKEVGERLIAVEKRMDDLERRYKGPSS
jgi:hypothetical protein